MYRHSDICIHIRFAIYTYIALFLLNFLNLSKTRMNMVSLHFNNRVRKYQSELGLQQMIIFIIGQSVDYFYDKSFIPINNVKKAWKMLISISQSSVWCLQIGSFVPTTAHSDSSFITINDTKSSKSSHLRG